MGEMSTVTVLLLQTCTTVTGTRLPFDEPKQLAYVPSNARDAANKTPKERSYGPKEFQLLP